MKLAATIVVIIALGLGSAASAEVPPPLGVTSRDIGGGALNQYTPGVESGKGLNNIGLLVRMWGRVTFVDSTNKFFYIDDGCGREDGSGNKGVRVSYDNLALGETFSPPAQYSYVAITGISSTVMINTKVQPNLRPRRDADKTVF